MDREIIWIKTTRGELLPCVCMYMYRVTHRNNEASALYCQCVNDSCSVTLKVENGAIKYINGVHLHMDDTQEIIRKLVTELLKERISVDPFLSPVVMFNGVLEDIAVLYNHKETIVRVLPSFDSFRSNIHRWRRKLCVNTNINDEFQNLDTFKISSGESLLLYHEMSDDKIVILGDITYITRFSNRNNGKFFLDGTFKSSSVHFKQLYIIHVEQFGQVFPLFYCFLNKKTESMYVKVFRIIIDILQRNAISLRFDYFQIDFEMAVFNALRLCFPNSEIKGCFFHLGQAIWRKVQELGLRRVFNENDQFKNAIELILALALVPPAEIDFCWVYIKALLNNVNNSTITDLIDYVERTWLSNNTALYCRNVWSRYGEIRGRTNNSIEGFHGKLNSLLKRNQLGFSHILHIVKKCQINSDIEFLRLVNGGKQRIRKKKYILQEERVLRIWTNYQNGEITTIELLVGLKNSIKLNI